MSSLYLTLGLSLQIRKLCLPLVNVFLLLLAFHASLQTIYLLKVGNVIQDSATSKFNDFIMLVITAIGKIVILFTDSDSEEEKRMIIGQNRTNNVLYANTAIYVISSIILWNIDSNI